MYKYCVKDSQFINYLKEMFQQREKNIKREYEIDRSSNA